MKILLLFTFLLFGVASMNAQMIVTYKKVNALTETRVAPTVVKKTSPKKMHSSIKRIVKIIPKEEKTITKKTATYSTKSKKRLVAVEEDVPF